MSSVSVGRLRPRLSVLPAWSFALGLLASAVLVPALAETPATPPATDASPAPAAPRRGSGCRYPRKRRPRLLPQRRRAGCRCAVGPGADQGHACPSSISARNMRSRCRSLMPRSRSPIKASRARASCIKEANQAGTFVGFAFELVEAIVPADGDVVAKAKEILAKGDAFIIADLEPTDLVAVADLPEAKNSVIMNIRSSADALRQELCRSNVFHIIPD